MRLTKAQYDALPDELKTSFTLNGEEYTNGEEKAAELKSALEKERDAKKAAAAERDKLKEAADKAEEARKAAELAAARKGGDFGKIEADYKAKLAAAEKAARDATEAITREKVTTARTKVVAELKELFTTPSIVENYLEKRVSPEIDAESGKVLVRVVDPDGNPTADSLADLKKEILANKEFSTILKGSKGGGGGATPPASGGGATGGKDGKTDFVKMSLSEKVAHLKARGIGAET